MKQSEHEGSIELVVIGVIAALILVIAFPLCMPSHSVVAGQAQQHQIR